MHQDGLHADVPQQDDILQRLVLGMLHGLASDLDHDDLAVEPLDVRKRLDENHGSLFDTQRHVV